MNSLVSVAALVACAGVASAPISAHAADNNRVVLSNVSKRSVLVFPMDILPTTLSNAEEVSTVATEVVTGRLTSTNVYTVVRFGRALAPVVRLRRDQLLTDADVKGPFSDDNLKPTKITKLVGADIAFVGAIDEYSYDEAANQATVTMSGRLIDTTTDPVKVIKLVTLSGASSKGGNAKEPEKAIEAARDTAEKLMTQLAPAPIAVNTTTQAAAPVKHVRKTGRKDWLWGVAAVAVGLTIGLLSSGGHGSSGPGGSDTPPGHP